MFVGNKQKNLPFVFVHKRLKTWNKAKENKEESFAYNLNETLKKTKPWSCSINIELSSDREGS